MLWEGLKCLQVASTWRSRRLEWNIVNDRGLRRRCSLPRRNHGVLPILFPNSLECLHTLRPLREWLFLFQSSVQGSFLLCHQFCVGHVIISNELRELSQSCSATGHAFFGWISYDVGWASDDCSFLVSVLLAELHAIRHVFVRSFWYFFVEIPGQFEIEIMASLFPPVFAWRSKIHSRPGLVKIT